MNRCKNCIMPETNDYIYFDDEGICNVCRKHEKLNEQIKVRKEYSYDTLKERINKIIGIKDSQYDCVVAVSGGKDSIMTLYVAAKKLNLKTLGVFIDNGFSTDELYQNSINAADSLGVDLIVFKTDIFKRMFKYTLLTKQSFYYCRLCHAIIDKLVKDIAIKYNINLILGGFTKGQDYIKIPELFHIFKTTDDFIEKELSKIEEFNEITQMFPNLAKYFSTQYPSINHISPFWYIEWNEDEIIDFISKELGFVTPSISWPKRSSNCLFNFISQFLAVRNFGYSQHEPELSTLIRKNEITREKALGIINTPISKDEIQNVLNILDLKYEDII